MHFGLFVTCNSMSGDEGERGVGLRLTAQMSQLTPHTPGLWAHLAREHGGGLCLLWSKGLMGLR